MGGAMSQNEGGRDVSWKKHFVEVNEKIDPTPRTLDEAMRAVEIAMRSSRARRVRVRKAADTAGSLGSIVASWERKGRAPWQKTWPRCRRAIGVLLDRQERASVLAGLRLLQRGIERRELDGMIREIATDAGEVPLQRLEEIDDLCERVNTGSALSSRQMGERSSAVPQAIRFEVMA